MREYSDKVLEHFMNPRNAGPLPEANAVGEVGSLSSGDAVRLMLKVNSETDVIEDARFQTFGCAPAIAASSALTVMIIGKAIGEARAVTSEDIVAFLDGLPPEKSYCSVMGEEALAAALAAHAGATRRADAPAAARPAPRPITIAMPGARSCGPAAALAAMIAPPVGNAPESSPEIAPEPAAPAPGRVDEAILAARVFEQLRPVFRRDGGDVELIDLAGSVARVRMSGACAGCLLASQTLGGLQKKLSEALGRDVRVVPAAKV